MCARVLQVGVGGKGREKPKMTSCWAEILTGAETKSQVPSWLHPGPSHHRLIFSLLDNFHLVVKLTCEINRFPYYIGLVQY